MSYRQDRPVNIPKTGEFFLGSLNKSLTRNEIYSFLANYKLSNGKSLYIKKFNQPKITTRTVSANKRPIKNVGYAFVVTKYKWMADLIIKQKYRKLLYDLTGSKLINDFQGRTQI